LRSSKNAKRPGLTRPFTRCLKDESSQPMRSLA
jgi:hypothetical protein